MESIKELFIKYFNICPDIISTTEHAYISPPARIISSLTMLANKDKKILRIIMTDRYSLNPEAAVRQICIPYVLNKTLFEIRNNIDKHVILNSFDADITHINDILKVYPLFSDAEKVNFLKLIKLYKNIINQSSLIDIAHLYNDITIKLLEAIEFHDVALWLKNTDFFDINSDNIRFFVKDSIKTLYKINPETLDLFGNYLEKKNRLKVCSNKKSPVTWSTYLEKLNSNINECFVPYEMILYIYSYVGGLHFGNDYGVVDDINKIRNFQNIKQITKHNKDYQFNIELENILFMSLSKLKGKWILTNKKNQRVNTLTEEYIIFGQEKLKNIFNELKKKYE